MFVVKLIHQATIVLWAVVLAFCLMSLIGMTGFFSSLVGQDRVEMAVDVVFLVLVIIFALSLARLFSPPQKRGMKILAFFTPLALFLAFFNFF